MLSLGYIHRNRDSNKQWYTSDSQSIVGICVGNDPKSDGLLFYLPISKKIVGSADYRLNLNVPSVRVFGYSYDGGIGLNLYKPSTNTTRLPSYETEEQIYFKTKKMQEYQNVKVLVNSWDDAEPVKIQTHSRLNIMQVEPKYVTNINT